MEQQNNRTKIIELFEQAGHAHHQAFIAVDGADEEWAAWYANYLATKLATVLKIKLAPESLAPLLEKYEDQRQAENPDANWAEFYTDQILKEKI